MRLGNDAGRPTSALDTLTLIGVLTHLRPSSSLISRSLGWFSIQPPDLFLYLPIPSYVNQMPKLFFYKPLLAAVYRQAIKDARLGDAGAIEFLDITTPDWRELSSRLKGN